jgi:tRNA pseudouridine38-40 synthase
MIWMGMIRVSETAASGLQRYRLDVSYDGTAFAGWQVQPRHRTAQGDLEHALKQLTGATHVRVEASGRTDAGVHARGQVAHVDLPQQHRRPDKLRQGINALIDEDLRILQVRAVPDSFHARFSAKGKEYRYTIDNAPVRSPLTRLHSAWIRDRLDVDAMQQAARQLEGRHDFAAFAANPNREIDGTIRTLYRLSVARRGDRITLRAVGDGFLYKMVRSLAGFLIRVGRGEVEPAATQAILDSRIRTARVPTAPPEGLCLWHVYYRNPPVRST